MEYTTLYPKRPAPKPLVVSDIVRSYPSHPSKYIVVRMVIEVDTELLWDKLDGEDGEPGLTVEDMVKVLQRELEQIKQAKYGIPAKLPDWFKSVDCAEIEETREDANG